MKMKRTIVNVKANKKDEFWCSLHGNALEIMGANLSILKHTVEALKGEGERGEKFLQMLYEDVEEVFQENGIRIDKKKGKKTKEND